MRIVLYTGGARSGKSRLAQTRAFELGGSAVTFLATGRATDDEMAGRIRRHRRDRPEAWETLEAPVGAGEALERARHSVVLLDCLTFLVSNALLAGEHEEEAARKRSERAVDALLDAAGQLGGHLVVVTNEVGMGVVPPTRLGRWFRDAQGWANQKVARAADEVVWVVSGVAVEVKG